MYLIHVTQSLGGFRSEGFLSNEGTLEPEVLAARFSLQQISEILPTLEYDGCELLMVEITQEDM